MAQWEVGDAGLLPQSRECLVDDVLAIASEFPNLVLVLNHLSGQADGTEQEQVAWRAKIAKLASCPNAFAKVGGAGMPDRGYGLADRAVPVGSEELAQMTLPYYGYVIDTFGPERCMFESNCKCKCTQRRGASVRLSPGLLSDTVPVDKQSFSYTVCWNAFKRLAKAKGLDEQAKAALYGGTATRVYRLEPRGGGGGRL